MKRTQIFIGISLILVSLASPGTIFGFPVGLQNATATFSQGVLPISETIDGDYTNGGNGWGIWGSIVNQTAVWETSSDLTDASSIEFKMQHLQDGGFLLGRFRWSATTDDRSVFADGLPNSGDVTANWTALSNPAIAGPSGTTFTDLGDDSILVGGTNPSTGVYTITYNNISLNAITGFRLEVLEHSSLPFNGPGRYTGDGNFVLTELEVSATSVPEPATIALLGIGLAGLGGGYLRRRPRKKKITEKDK